VENAVLYNETISGLEPNSTVDGLESLWIPDPLNGNNIELRVGPVDGTDTQSSYQCINEGVHCSIGTFIEC